MSDLVVFPDAAAIVGSYLRDELTAHEGAAVTVVSKVPTDRPARFVLVRRLGGVRHTVITDAATVGVEAWDDDGDVAADALAQLARALLHQLPGQRVDGTVVHGVTEAAGPQDFPDPDSRTPRSVFTVSVLLRGDVTSGS